MDSAKLISAIRAHEIQVGVIGLGYVGLPLVIRFSKCNFKVIGFDIDEKKVDCIQRGESYIHHIKSEEFADEWRISATTDFSKTAECDVLIICVPTPLNRNREPDMSCIESTADAIGPYLKRNQLVVLESTTYPGTTDTLLKNRLEKLNNLQAGMDYFLAFSPEREDPGNKTFKLKQVPKIVGGLTDECTQVACAVYQEIVEQVVPVSNTRIAEMTKLYENIFRSVNIALVNEVKMLCHRMDIDPWEVVKAAATKPFGFMPFYPGPGLGGHCIPIDPFYLTWKAREYGLSTRFIELAGEINTNMPEYVVRRLSEALNWQGKCLKQAKVLLLGVAYKKDIDDMRESPALRIIDLLQEFGAQVSYHDPFVAALPDYLHYNQHYKSVELTEDVLAACDAAVIVTDHSNVDYQSVVKYAPLVIDTRNVAGTPNGSRKTNHVVAA